MQIKAYRMDILKLPVDIIVIPANPKAECAGGSGIEKGLYQQGGEALKDLRNKIGDIRRGSCELTEAGDYKNAQFVIHAVGPGKEAEGTDRIKVLRECYQNVFETIKEYQVQYNKDNKNFEVSLPLLAAGADNCPLETALAVQLGEAVFFAFNNSDMPCTLYLLYYGDGAEMYQRVLGSLDELGKSKLQLLTEERKTNRNNYPPNLSSAGRRMSDKSVNEINEIKRQGTQKKRTSAFYDCVRKCAQEYAKRNHMEEQEDADIILNKCKVHLDKSILSRMKNNGYKPSRSTVYKIAIALHATDITVQKLMTSAGMFPAPDIYKEDKIAQEFIKKAENDSSRDRDYVEEYCKAMK
ncbi:macro domain-containing protein [Bilifractor sp. LCP19S3_H10]|uniref:macro domain-containing protein n=1 Tax=Bilifractor sp. LCP19S3_H10 TaxID=3438736 RepID=UPI003F8F523D